MKIDIASGQIQGDRDYQQDAFGYRDVPIQHKLLFLADGMGGYEGGEVASGLVIKTFMDENPSVTKAEDFLYQLLLEANRQIAIYKESNPNLSSMGTTLIAVSIIGYECRYISVGDSPLYRIRDNSIKRINENHSVAGLLELQVKKGEISEDEAKSNPNRHMLTSALMGDEISMIDLSPPIKVKPNDIFILASDGIETLSEDEILKLVLSSNGHMEMAVDRILSEIESKGRVNQDNVSLIIASVSEDENLQSTFIPTVDNSSEMVNKRGWNVLFITILIGLFIVLISLIGIVVGLPEKSYQEKIVHLNDNNELNENITPLSDTVQSISKGIGDRNNSS